MFPNPHPPLPGSSVGTLDVSLFTEESSTGLPLLATKMVPGVGKMIQGRKMGHMEETPSDFLIC